MPSSSPEPNLFLHFTRRFEELKIPYMVTGSIAAIFYGVVRLTNDVDLVAVFNIQTSRQLPSLFASEEFYCPPADIIGVEMARDRRGHFNIIHIESGFKADVYLAGNDPLHTWALARTRSFHVDGNEIRLAPPEYVIVRKLEFFREGGSEKHLRDIRTMLESSRELINMDEMNRMVSGRLLNEQWTRVNKTQM
jgi:hypothetical protein